MTPSHNAGNVLGIDVGGTTIKGARFDRDLVGSAVATQSTPPEPDQIVEAIARLAGLLRDDATRAVAVVVPGVVDGAAGVVRLSANLNWRDVPLRDTLAAELGLPVLVDHDVAAATRSESQEKTGDLLFVSLGTGIAAGHIVTGLLWRGATGQAGELGHITVVPGGEKCGCGQFGCLEAYASAAAIERRYAAAAGTAVTAVDLAARLETDPVAAAVWREAVDALGLALATEVRLFDPAVIVLGGGLAQAGDRLLDPLREDLARRLAWRSAPPIRAAVHGAAAGQRGAAVLAWELADRVGDPR